MYRPCNWCMAWHGRHYGTERKKLSGCDQKMGWCSENPFVSVRGKNRWKNQSWAGIPQFFGNTLVILTQSMTLAWRYMIWGSGNVINHNLSVWCSLSVIRPTWISSKGWIKISSMNWTIVTANLELIYSRADFLQLFASCFPRTCIWVEPSTVWQRPCLGKRGKKISSSRGAPPVYQPARPS